MQNRYMVGILILVLWILLCLFGRTLAQDDCLDYYDCHEAQYKISWACVVEQGWLSAEDAYEFPLILVTTDGDYEVNDNEQICNAETSRENHAYNDNRIDWSTEQAAIYGGDNGAEIYCLDAEGNGNFALSLTEETLNATDFGCGVFYILPDTCEYQLNLDDGITLISDNLWFIGAYYGLGNTGRAVADSCAVADGSGAGVPTDDSNVVGGDTG